MDIDELERIAAPYDSKAAKIRALNEAGVSTTDISTFLGIRYQHTYNVLLRAGRIVRSEEKASSFLMTSSARSTSRLVAGSSAGRPRKVCCSCRRKKPWPNCAGLPPSACLNTPCFSTLSSIEQLAAHPSKSGSSCDGGYDV
jgi:hypothetical protein